MSQTSVSNRPAIGIAGQLASLAGMKNSVVLTKTSEEVAAGIPFGVMLAEGAGDDGALLLSSNDDRLAGVSCHGHGFAEPQELDDDGLQPGATFGAVFVGPVTVRVEGDVTPASEVHVRAVAASNEIAGAFRATADGADTIDCSAFCRFLTSSSGGLAVLWVDMGNMPLAQPGS